MHQDASMHAWYSLNMHISLTELRRTPAAALDHVRGGEEVTITEAGIPLCRMIPVGRASRYEQLVAEGLIRPPVKHADPEEVRAMSLASWVVSAT